MVLCTVIFIIIFIITLQSLIRVPHDWASSAALQRMEIHGAERNVSTRSSYGPSKLAASSLRRPEGASQAAPAVLPHFPPVSLVGERYLGFSHASKKTPRSAWRGDRCRALANGEEENGGAWRGRLSLTPLFPQSIGSLGQEAGLRGGVGGEFCLRHNCSVGKTYRNPVGLLAPARRGEVGLIQGLSKRETIN